MGSHPRGLVLFLCSTIVQIRAGARVVSCSGVGGGDSPQMFKGGAHSICKWFHVGLRERDVKGGAQEMSARSSA